MLIGRATMFFLMRTERGRPILSSNTPNAHLQPPEQSVLLLSLDSVR